MEHVYDEKTYEKIRQEFIRLQDECYLDHAGATLYSEVQMKNIFNDLCSNVYGNPHSLSQSSKYSTDLIDQIRSRILNHFHTNTEEYSLIFTSGATAAIKLLLENFNWDAKENEDDFFDASSEISEVEKGAYIYTQSNHTSIIGGREIAALNNVPFFCLSYDESFSILSNCIPHKIHRHVSNSIFAYPAQCNFSGRKYPLDWIWKVQNGALDTYGLCRKRNSKWFCLLDAATYCSTNDLNLAILKPDFVCISFYKIFGYPTGLGALLVRNSSSFVLDKKYFGGGTVEISLPKQDYHKLRSVLHERFEDGTVPFLSIIALDHGLRTLKRLSLTTTMISEHVFNLARYAVERLKSLRHWNDVSAVEIYADSEYVNVYEQGGIVNFNLKRPDGRYIGFVEVLHIANLNKIHFRTGCFCNTGACQRHLKLTDEDMKLHYEAGHICGDTKDLINGRPTGSIRISFGYMTTHHNIDKLIAIINESFVEKTAPEWILHKNHQLPSGAIYLKKIFTYPVKSCGAMEVSQWRINERGLEYDREWMIVNENGICLTQKQEPKLSLIKPKIDFDLKILKLSFRGSLEGVSVPLEADGSVCSYDLCESKVCGDRIKIYDCGDKVSEWLSKNLGVKGLRLVRQCKEDERKCKSKESLGMLSLSNQAQYLMINDASVRWLQSRIEAENDFNPNTLADRFRGNFLIDGGEEFSENEWSKISIGNKKFQVQGQCTRCQMICIDQHTGEKNRKPLVALSKALNGKLRFGIYLSYIGQEENPVLRVGDPIVVEQK